jgi:hypothetical protein
VETKRLNEQVKRNRDRCPPDFLFQRTAAEKAEVVANCDHLGKLKFSKVLPLPSPSMERFMRQRQEGQTR